MIEPLKTLNAVKILNDVQSNSVPLEILADDGDIYFVKTIFKNQPPLEDLINETICHYLFGAWNIIVPAAAIVKISKDALDAYKNKTLDKRYLNNDIEKLFFFGSRKLENVTEYNKENLFIKDKNQFKKFENPLDFIKIAVFDNWIANKDRRTINPNLMLQALDQKFRIVPIDNVQCFACQSNYKGLSKAVMNIFPTSTLIVSDMLKSICNFADSNIITNLEKTILEDMNRSLSSLDDIFNQIPSEFGLSKAGKGKIRDVLSDKIRNSRLSRLYLSYQK